MVNEELLGNWCCQLVIRSNLDTKAETIVIIVFFSCMVTRNQMLNFFLDFCLKKIAV